MNRPEVKTLISVRKVTRLKHGVFVMEEPRLLLVDDPCVDFVTDTIKNTFNSEPKMASKQKVTKPKHIPVTNDDLKKWSPGDFKVLATRIKRWTPEPDKNSVRYPLWKDLDKILSLKKSGKSNEEIGEMFGASRETVRLFINECQRIANR